MCIYQCDIYFLINRINFLIINYLVFHVTNVAVRTLLRVNFVFCCIVYTAIESKLYGFFNVSDTSLLDC